MEAIIHSCLATITKKSYRFFCYIGTEFNEKFPQCGERKVLSSMIEILNGMTETINYRNALDFRLFHNVDYEDYPTHWHVGIEILMPVTENYGVIVEQKKYVLEKGDILIVNSGVPHALEAPPTGERIILQFDPALLYSLKEMETLLLLFPSVFYVTKRMSRSCIRLSGRRWKKSSGNTTGSSRLPGHWFMHR